MNTHRTATTIAGALFLFAIVVSIAGGTIVEANLLDAEGVIRLDASRPRVALGVILELLNVIAVIGIAALLFPILYKHNRALSVAYVGNRIVEAIVQIVGSSIPLALVTLGETGLALGALEASSIQGVGALGVAARATLLGTIMGIFFNLGAALFYAIVYRARLLPRFIPIWGFVGVAGVLTWNLLEMFGIQAGIYLAIPIILNEIVLGIWLIAKGFNGQARRGE